VKGISQDFCHPDQAGHHIPDKEQLDGAKQQGTKADDQPDLPDVLDEGCAISVRRKNSEQRRVPPQQRR